MVQKLKAPQNDGESLVYPDWNAAADLLNGNRQIIDGSAARILDSPLREFATEAKRELLRLATDYTSAYQPLEKGDGSPLQNVILSGHQPTLFHPGVWFKNFALHRLAKTHAAIGIHLLIDNDLSREPGIGILGGTDDQPSVKRVNMDVGSKATPHEARPVFDQEMFRQFGELAATTARELMASGEEEVVVDRMWPHAAQALDRTKNLGECISQARHQVECDLGLTNLEVPLSRVCDGKAFQQFLAHMLAHGESLHASYNNAILEYREQNRLRSNSHPAPLLRESNHDGREDDKWVELPFWGWAKHDVENPDELPTRQPVFIHADESASHELSIGVPDDPTSRSLTLPRPTSASGLESFRESILNSGVAIRPRALTTTMFARLCLSDLFIHGIGGAKYDVVTDRVMHSLFKIQPTSYMAISATFRPLVSQQIDQPTGAQQIAGQLRELWFHPEKTELPSSRPREDHERFADLKQKKRDLLLAAKRYGEGNGNGKGHGEGSRKAWHDELSAINRKLREFHEAHRNDLLAGQKQLAITNRHFRILSSREYSFCSFPYRRLSEQLLATF